MQPEGQKQEELTTVHLETMSKIYFSQTSSDNRGHNIQSQSAQWLTLIFHPPSKPRVIKFSLLLTYLVSFGDRRSRFFGISREPLCVMSTWLLS